MKKHVFAAVMLVWTAAVAAGAPGTQVRSIGLTADEASAALAVNLSARGAYRVTTARNPARITVTLRHARAAAGLQMPQAAGVVTGVTAQPAGNGDLRLTILLARSVSVHGRWEGAAGTGPTLIFRLGSQQRGHPSVAATPRPVQAAHAPRDSGRDIVIAVDAGHGGEDPGATGHAGVHEKDVVLAIARALASRIDAEAGMHAVLTRERDEFLTLRER
ncbi:MAG TPA: N-acetylmuramoyl-L-alanine amidase, partial [Steroidobacteraceae bacterium]|nr:N-acetylmuramoyl-L-alanine amidase [Steroidobacteraceae bacterium]